MATLAKPKLKSDRARIEALIKKDYLNDSDHMGLQAEIDKLLPSDTWAIPLALALLNNKKLSHHGAAKYAARALAEFGPAARDAIPDLVYASIDGYARNV